MKMKKIDLFLKEECNLGYILRYLSERATNNDKYQFPVIDLLRNIPEFKSSVISIRKSLSINPEVEFSKLQTNFGEKDVNNFFYDLENIGRGIGEPKLAFKKIDALAKKIDKWIDNNYLKLHSSVSILRLKTFGKLPLVWHRGIVYFILFDAITPINIFFHKRAIKPKVKIDKKTLEPYLEIKIFSDTDISSLKKINLWKEYQKKLPNYINPSMWDEDKNLMLSLHLILKSNLNLSQKEIYNWLKSKNFLPSDINHLSQDLARFKDKFIKNTSK